MSTGTAHLCLVSQQVTPNLTPALDPATAPQRVILLTSPDMERRAGWLASVLRKRGLKVESWPMRFVDEDARFFVNGGWLESYTHDRLLALRRTLPQIQDLARSLEITRETLRGEPVPNEIDVACLAENRLFLIECKTRQWQGREGAGAGANALYRLDVLKDLLGGLQARAMLVSYRSLPAHDQRRAADLRIRVCAGARLRELGSMLSDWIGT